MGNLHHIQTDFGWGEISPKMLCRTDLTQYSKATKTMENAYSFIHGGCTRRPGTEFVGELYNSDQKAKLIPFTHSTALSYLLIFNGNKIEFVKNTGQFVKSGASNYQLASPYSESELQELSYAQAGNVLFLAHPNHAPQQLERVSDAVWVLQPVPITYQATTDYWYENAHIQFKILGGATKFAVGDKFTFSTVGNVAGTITFSGTGNGKLAQLSIKSSPPDQIWTIECKYVDSSKQIWDVTGSVSGQLICTWSAGNYPGAVAFFEQRLWLGGTSKSPQTVWASKTSNYTDFTLGGNDADALSFTIASNNFDGIRHLTSARQLLPLTYSGEFSMVGGLSGITPTSVKIQPQTFHGTSSVRPIRIGPEVIFVQRDNKKLRAISYSVTEDANVAPDITLFAEHITGDGLTDIAFAQVPDYIAWGIRADGVMLSLTLAREYETTSWARHITQGKFENVATIQNGESEDCYVIVRRTINGQSKLYLERLSYGIGLFSDCGVVLSNPEGVKSTSFSGLSWLEGCTVDVVADGLVHPSVVVSGGSIVLQYPANSVKVGLHYNTKIELLHPEFGDGKTSSSLGRRLSIYEAVFKFHNTTNCRVNNYEVPFRKNTDGLDKVIPPYTGDKKVSTFGWRTPNNMVIEQVTPMPFTLLGVVLKAAVNE